MTDDYREILRRLTALDDDAAAHRAQAADWFDARMAAAEEKVREADDAVREAGDAVRAAERELDRVDADAAGLWADFVHRTGPRAERFGRTKPGPAVPRQPDRSAEEYLQEAAGQAAWTPPSRPLTSGTTVLFGLFGFVGGLLGVIGGQLLRRVGREAGGDWATGLPVIALLVLILGPVLAVVAAKRVADRRGAGLDATAVAVVLVTGLVTAGLLFAAIQSAATAR